MPNVILCKDSPQHSVYKLVLEKLAEKEGNLAVLNSLTLGFMEDEKIVGGIIFSLTNRVIYLTIWTENSNWCTRTNLANIFELGFDFGAMVIKCTTDYKNYRVNKLLRGIGFRREGILRYSRNNGHDEIVWGLTKKEMQDQKWWKSIRSI